jgi:hypothetical protein
MEFRDDIDEFSMEDINLDGNAPLLIFNPPLNTILKKGDNLLVLGKYDPLAIQEHLLKKH